MGYTGEQKREYQRRWLYNRRQRGLSLLGGKCVKCGSISELEFDHIDPSLKDPLLFGSTGRLWSWSWPRILGELEKCQLLCSDCHKVKTRNSRPVPEHGTTNRYESTIHACRCKLCKSAKAQYEKARRNPL